MERQAPQNSLPLIDSSRFPAAPWRPGPSRPIVPEVKPVFPVPSQEDYEAFFSLLWTSTQVNQHVRKYMPLQLPGGSEAKPYPSREFFDRLNPLQAMAEEARGVLNAYAARIGGLPVRYALASGEELSGRVTEWQEYAETGWKVMVTRDGHTTSEPDNLTIDQLVTAYISATTPQSDMIEQCPVDDPAEF